MAFTSVAVHFYHPLMRVCAPIGRRPGVRRRSVGQSLVEDARSYTRGLARLRAALSRITFGSTWLVERFDHAPFVGLSGKEARNAACQRSRAGSASYDISLVRNRRQRRRARPGDGVFAGAAAADDSPKTASPPVAETARLPSEKDTSTAAPGTPAAEQAPFSRPDFNPATIGLGKSGGFLIRVGDLLRHPEIQPHVDAINEKLKKLLGKSSANPPKRSTSGKSNGSPATC